MEQHKIGEVAERTGLSLRTIRYYEEVGLVTPSSRTHGGFRLYSDADIARFEVIKRMKPLDFSLEEMRDLLGIMGRLDDDGDAPAERARRLDQLAMYQVAAEERCRSLREQLAIAEEFSATLLATIGRHERAADPTR
ncbi:MerR family transcriptional regulator [Cellulomonas sp. ATA003]|uniref:MerR family transcriptional regulator n=1 Tax=Cellulomonas sp. ATA003 TaxID=3073064 RepID=UPI0028734B8D|nr:MerR family transcriptional regulator [Cellulomonas sp. ATA003]WNB87263.1 MerR family transcriptional regulator [Cellulomonas sp. ATA003]